MEPFTWHPDGDDANADWPKRRRAEMEPRYRNPMISWRAGTVHIPPNLHGSLVAYVEEGRSTGDFLRAVMTNDLRGAMMRADDMSLRILPHLWAFIYNYCPGPCHGSAENVRAWMDHGGLFGLEVPTVERRGEAR